MAKRKTPRPGTSRTPKKEAWPQRFIAALRKIGNISEACKAARVGRSTVYIRREEDAAFAAEWLDALDEAADVLEFEAQRRGKDGVDEPVIYQGELMGIWVMPDGTVVAKDTPGAVQVPLTVKKYSDTLLIFLLKGIRPDKFRENVKHEHGGEGGGPIVFAAMTDDERRAAVERALSRLAGGPHKPAGGQPPPP